MITFWNRKEVYTGNSLDTFNKASDILDANKIKYDYKYGNLGGISASDPYSNMNNQCYIYVHKKNSEQASFLLRDIWSK